MEVVPARNFSHCTHTGTSELQGSHGSLLSTSEHGGFRAHSAKSAKDDLSTSWHPGSPRRSGRRRKATAVSPAKKTPTKLKIATGQKNSPRRGHSPEKERLGGVNRRRVENSLAQKQSSRHTGAKKLSGCHSPKNAENAPSSDSRKQASPHRRKKLGCRSPGKRALPGKESEGCTTPSDSKHRQRQQKSKSMKEVDGDHADNIADISPSAASRLSSVNRTGKRSPRFRKNTRRRFRKGENSVDTRIDVGMAGRKETHKENGSRVEPQKRHLQIEPPPLTLSPTACLSPSAPKDDELSVYTASSDSSEDSSLNSGTSVGSFSVQPSVNEQSSHCGSVASSVCPSVSSVFDIETKTIEEIVVPNPPSRQASNHRREEKKAFGSLAPLSSGNAVSGLPFEVTLSDPDEACDDGNLSVYTTSSESSQDSELDSGTSAGSFTADCSIPDEMSATSSVRSSVACFFETGNKSLDEILAPSQPTRVRSRHSRADHSSVSSSCAPRQPLRQLSRHSRIEEVSLSSSCAPRLPLRMPSRHSRHMSRTDACDDASTKSSRDDAPSQPSRQRTQHGRSQNPNDADCDESVRRSTRAERRKRKQNRHKRKTKVDYNHMEDDSSSCPSGDESRRMERRSRRGRKTKEEYGQMGDDSSCSSSEKKSRRTPRRSRHQRKTKEDYDHMDDDSSLCSSVSGSPRAEKQSSLRPTRNISNSIEGVFEGEENLSVCKSVTAPRPPERPRTRHDRKISC